MHSSSAGTGAWIGAGVALFLSIVFYYFAVLRIDYHRTGLLDLDPQPDAVEYFAQAEAIARRGWPSIQIGHDLLPSRYPPGYPLLMVPWIKLLAERDAILAPFRTNQTIGLLVIIGAFAVYARLRAPLAAGAAALLTATLPAFFTYSRSSLSEMSASAFAVAAFALVHAALRNSKRRYIYAAAGLLGLSINIRAQFLFFAPLLLAMALIESPRRAPWRWLLHCVGGACTFAIACSPLFLLNTVEFQSPFKTGYDFWVPMGSDAPLFSLRNLPTHGRMLWSELILRRQNYAIANMFGTGTHFVPAFVVLAGIGVVLVRPTRFTLCAGIAAITFVAATALYSGGGYIDKRFYLPIFILLVTTAVLSVEWAATSLLLRRHRIVSVLILLTAAAAIAGYPSQSGYRPTQGHSQAWDALRWGKANNTSPRFVAQQQFASSVPNEAAILLSDVDSVYLNTLLPDSIVAAPIDGRHSYRHSKIWRYDAQNAIALINRATENGVAAYALFPSASEMDSAKLRLPSFNGLDWVVHSESPAGMILKLRPAGPAE